MPATADEVRSIARGLPEVTERPAWDMSCLRVRDRIFAALPPDETWVAVLVGHGENTALAAERPAVFSVPHHYRNSPVVVVSLAAVDRQERPSCSPTPGGCAPRPGCERLPTAPPRAAG